MYQPKFSVHRLREDLTFACEIINTLKTEVCRKLTFDGQEGIYIKIITEKESPTYNCRLFDFDVENIKSAIPEIGRELEVRALRRQIQEARDRLSVIGITSGEEY